MKKLNQNRYYKFYLEYFRPRFPLLLLLIFIIMVGVVSGNLNPFIYGKMIDFITVKDLGSLERYIIIYFCINLFAVVLSMIESYVGQLVSYFITSDVRRELFTKIVRMRFRGLDAYGVGELISRLDSDAGGVVDFYIDVATSVILITFNLVVSVYFVFTISAALSFVSVFFIPASAIVTIAFRKKYRALEKKNKEYYDKYVGFTNETFSNLRGIRSYQLEDAFESKFSGFVTEKLGLTKRSIRLNNTVSLLKNLISTIFGLLIIYLSARFIIAGTLTIGNMVAFNTYVNKLFDAVSRVLSMNVSMQSVAISMDRLEKLQNEPDETPLYEGTKPAGYSRLDIENLSFGYMENRVLDSLSLSCQKPGLYAIVGKNGCGKSTLARIIMGFYDCDGGRVSFDGSAPWEIGLKNLRRGITYIQKEVFITNNTVMNNIKLANPGAEDDTVIGICKRINLHEFIESLPDKYYTKLGESGSHLSSGQKQKLSIVRAFLRGSELLILDEVTSDLDGKAEKEITGLIKRLSETRIVLFISHKITSVMSSDRIFLIDGGTLADEGTHGELMERNELYRELFWLDEGPNVED